MAAIKISRVALKLLESGFKNEALLLLQASISPSSLTKTSRKELPKKHGRYEFFITGDDQGNWDLGPHFDFGALKYGKWVATAALSSKNNWKNLSVDNATEYHKGLRKAFKEILKIYPELNDWLIAFDGPYRPISDVFDFASSKEDEFDWANIDFFHGTSLWAWEQIKNTGLLPRKDSGVDPAYGAGVGAAPGREDAVYLTTQSYMAQAAARDASRSAKREGKSDKHVGVLLHIPGKYLNPHYIIADEDSNTSDPRKSLEKMGSIAYKKRIPAKDIKLTKILKF